MPDVFISHSSKDKKVADAVCAVLEQAGVRCWVAPRDVPPGLEWGEAILEGIASCRIMLIVFSQDANESPQVRREVERAVAKGLIVIPFRIEDVRPTKAMEYFISASHWLDAFTPPLQGHLEKLAKTIIGFLGPVAAEGDPAPGPEIAGGEPVPKQGRGSRRAIAWVGGAVAAVVAIGSLLYFVPWKKTASDRSELSATPGPSVGSNLNVAARASSPAPSATPQKVIVTPRPATPSPTPQSVSVFPTTPLRTWTPYPTVAVADPIVGKWHWVAHRMITFYADGTYIQNTGGSGKWKCTAILPPRRYELHWDGASLVDTLNMTSKGAKLTMVGGNNEGARFSVTK